jgi:hypothetical protein
LGETDIAESTNRPEREIERIAGADIEMAVTES